MGMIMVCNQQWAYNVDITNEDILGIWMEYKTNIDITQSK